MSSDLLIQVRDVSKCYPIFAQPYDRLKQFIIPRLMRLLPFSDRHKDATRKFFREFWSLKHVSFEIERGEMVGVIGRNGSGKSTLLQIVCGILSQSSGSVQTTGRIAALLELGAGFNPDFTGRENVLMNASILGLSDKEIAEKFDDIVAFSEIGEFIDQPVRTYSSGMYVRLAFSVAVSVEPDIVIVDEALSVGDIGFSMKCFHRIDEMRSNGVTFLLVTHDLGLVKKRCSRAIYLKSGEMVFDGDAESATEMYMMDMRGEQAASLNQTMAYKEALNATSIAFGTGQGRIISVIPSAGGELRAWFLHGESICLNVRAWLSDCLLSPAVVISVHDAHGCAVYGLDSRQLVGSLVRAAEGEVELQFDFDAKMFPGTYSVVARILDFPAGSSNVLIEKQLNVVSFEVMDNGRMPAGCYGIVELGGSCEQL